MTQADHQEELVNEIIKHLDRETCIGAMRMSVSMDDKQEEAGRVDHKCCYMYGRPASETVGLLDMYSDIGIEILRE